MGSLRPGACMSNLQNLRAELADLNQKIAAAHKLEVANAIDQVRSLVGAYKLGPADVFGSKAMVAARRMPTVPRYRDPISGSTWSGRGRAPAWIQGKDRSAYAIYR